MKFSSLQENLKKGLTVVSRIAGKNINLPILNNVMIDTRDGNIKLITTNLEIGVICTVRGKIEKDGVYTVDSKIISDFVSLLPNKKIEISKKDDKLKIECDNYKTIVKGQEADEYPLIPKIENKQEVRVNIESFKNALSQVVFAVSNSETRLELTGVLFSFENGKLLLAATDSYRLAEKEVDLNIKDESKINVFDGKKVIVPSKTLQEMIRLLSSVQESELNENGGDVLISLSDNQVLFSFGNVELISR